MEFQLLFCCNSDALRGCSVVLRFAAAVHLRNNLSVSRHSRRQTCEASTNLCPWMINMAVKLRLETLSIADINRLMKLAIEAGLRAHGFNAKLLDVYGAFAAQCHFELWSRQRGGQNSRRASRAH